MSFISPGQASFWHEGCEPGEQASHPGIPNDLVEENESGKGRVWEPAGGWDVGCWRGEKREEVHGGLGMWVLLEPGFGEYVLASQREERVGGREWVPLGFLPVGHNVAQRVCEFQKPGLGSWPHFLWSERLWASLNTSPSFSLLMCKMGIK